MAELQNSHLLPRAVYKVIRDAEAANPNPVVIRNGRPKQKSWQDQRHLLCHDCEQLLDKGGEKWVLATMWHRDGAFRLREDVESGVLVAGEDRFAIYDVTRTKVDADKLIHFAIGVFWKKSVWPENPIELGPYREKLRASSLGTDRLPPRCTVIAWVSRNQSELDCVAYDPVLLPRNDPKWRAYEFAIPGVHFWLAFGELPEELSSLHIGHGLIPICDGDRLTLNLLRRQKSAWLARAFSGA